MTRHAGEPPRLSYVARQPNCQRPTPVDGGSSRRIGYHVVSTYAYQTDSPSKQPGHFCSSTPIITGRDKKFYLPRTCGG